jgi:hypothetical protein
MWEVYSCRAVSSGNTEGVGVVDQGQGKTVSSYAGSVFSPGYKLLDLYFEDLD